MGLREQGKVSITRRKPRTEQINNVTQTEHNIQEIREAVYTKLVNFVWMARGFDR